MGSEQMWAQVTMDYSYLSLDAGRDYYNVQGSGTDADADADNVLNANLDAPSTARPAIAPADSLLDDAHSTSSHSDPTPPTPVTSLQSVRPFHTRLRSSHCSPSAANAARARWTLGRGCPRGRRGSATAPGSPCPSPLPPSIPTQTPKHPLPLK